MVDPPTNEWMKKLHTHTHTHTHSGYYMVMKKDILSFVTTCVDLEGIMLREISHREYNKYHMISLTCGV